MARANAISFAASNSQHIQQQIQQQHHQRQQEHQQRQQEHQQRQHEQQQQQQRNMDMMAAAAMAQEVN